MSAASMLGWRALALAGAAGAILVSTMPALGQTHVHPPGPAVIPLPSLPRQQERRIHARGAMRGPFPIAVTRLQGPRDVAQAALATLTRDFQLSTAFRALDLAGADTSKEAPLRIDPHLWEARGAEAVVKGGATILDDGRIHLDLALFVVEKPATVASASPALRRSYDIPRVEVASAVHRFANAVIEHLTQLPGSFGTHLLFSALVGEHERAIFRIGSEGEDLERLPAETKHPHAPTYGPGGSIYYTAPYHAEAEPPPSAGARGPTTYGLFRLGQPAAVITRPGRLLSVAFNGARMAIVAADTSGSDIYVGNADGSDLRKLTSGGINTHPAWGPKGELAYVSTRSGNPQVYVDGRRVSTRGTYNMAPAWCSDPEGVKVLFMGRDGTSWDIFSVDPVGGPASMTRLTENAGANTYPACSPDGRRVAFFSTRTQGPGLYVASVHGEDAQRISIAFGEGLRWEGN